MKRALLTLTSILLGLLVLLLALGATYTPNAQLPEGFHGKYITIAGVPIRYVQAGSGLDILLIHGSSGSVEDWEPIFAPLTRSFRVTAFDRPGHGFSGDQKDHSQRANSKVVTRLIEELNLKNVVLVGHSYGGPIALLSAARAHMNVRGVVVLDSALYEPLRSAEPRFKLLATPLIGIGIVRLTPRALRAAQIRAALPKEFRIQQPSAQFLQERGEIWSSPKVLHAIADEVLGSFHWLPVIWPMYSGVRAPLCVLAQADDPRRAAQAKRLHEQLPSSTLLLVPRAGHYLHHDRPDVVLDAIRKVAQ